MSDLSEKSPEAEETAEATEMTGTTASPENAPPIPAIEVTNLSRWFTGVHAVNDISFTVERGQVVGFVGANGAGKTTTMRILATLDYPSGGTARIAGYDVVQYPAKSANASAGCLTTTAPTAI